MGICITAQKDEYKKINNLEDKITTAVEQGTPSSVEKGNKFCKWILEYMFERTTDESEEDMKYSGKNDNSIDAWFINENGLNIIQAKYNTAHSGAAIAEFINNIDDILTDQSILAGINDEIKEDIEDFLRKNLPINLYYITNSYLTQTEQERSERTKEKKESQYKNVSIYILGLIEIEDFLEKALNPIPAKYRGHSTKLLLEKKFIGTDGITCLAEVALKNLALFVKKNKDYLFYSNIRNFLQNTSVNKAIRKTFHDNSKDFWYYNNGITIVCDSFEEDRYKDILTIVTPQIVNGCQTATTIYEEWVQLTKSYPEKANALEGTILVKIIQDKSGNKRDKITEFTNNQNAVSGKDYFALQNFHRKLQRDFGEIGYYFEIQKKSSLVLIKDKKNKVMWNKKYSGDEKYSYLFPDDFNNVLPVREVVQAYASGMHFLPATAGSRLGELAPGGIQYENLFNGQTPEDPYYFLFPYGVMRYAKKYLEYNSNSEVEYKKKCLTLFVGTYFQLIVMLLMKVGLYNKHENINPLEISIECFKRIFYNSELNKKLLFYTDDIIKQYTREGKILDLCGSDLTKFLKSMVQTNVQAKEILMNRIMITINEDIKKSEVEEFASVIECAELK